MCNDEGSKHKTKGGVGGGGAGDNMCAESRGYNFVFQLVRASNGRHDIKGSVVGGGRVPWTKTFGLDELKVRSGFKQEGVTLLSYSSAANYILPGPTVS